MFPVLFQYPIVTAKCKDPSRIFGQHPVLTKKGILYPKKRQLKFQHPLFKLFILKILQQNTFLLIFHEGAVSEIQTDVLSRLEPEISYITSTLLSV